MTEYTAQLADIVLTRIPQTIETSKAVGITWNTMEDSRKLIPLPTWNKHRYQSSELAKHMNI